MADTVLVTGGTGFVGGWCIVELLARGYTVRTTVRSLAREAALRARLAAAVDAGDRLEVAAADLTRDEGWDAAAAGCAYVLHVASPLGADDPKDPDDLIVPARDGTLRVLKAAVKAGVRRVVMTSSVAASSPPPFSPDSVNDETVWTDPDAPRLSAYRKSKTLAERAAWDFMAASGGTTQLATILPAAILGPVLAAEGLGSVQIVQRLLAGKVPGTPRLGFNIVDVRDLADLHVSAMTAPEAAGERFIAAGEYLWMADIARTLRERLGARAAKVPTRGLPDVLLRLIAWFDPPLRAVTPGLGRKHLFSAAKAQRVLGWASRPARASVIDCAESLIAHGAA